VKRDGQLFDAPAEPKLTARQAFAYDLVRRPRRAEEVGRWLHIAFGSSCRCSETETCHWADSAGVQMLSALRRKGLLIRRRETRLWERLDGVRDDREEQSDDIPY
jgi:hypothetical protein